MAGTVVITEVSHGSVKKITFAWTSDSGAADATTAKAYSGKLLGVTTDPDATAPDDNYDVEVQDADGDDLLLGAGANRDTLNTEFIKEADLGAVAGSALTLAVTNAGDAKLGEVHVWLR